MYKAIIDIGDFKAGQIVPDEIAEVWANMYKVSPVEKIGGSEVPVEPVKVVPEVQEEPVEEVEEVKEEHSWIDDYLGRNSGVVKSNIKKDKFEDSDLEAMVKFEGENKNRQDVLKVLNKKLKG